jgi:hypothetical protein
MEEHNHHQGRQSDSHKDARKKERKGRRVAFLAVFAGALMAEAILFMRVQSREISLILKDDFRIVAVKADRIKRDSAGMEEEFKALPGTAEVVFVSRAERLRRLKEEDPDLVGAVMNMASNPLPDTFEISLEEAALGDLAAWVESAWKINGVADLKYKPLEATAILHSLFYGHYLLVALTLSFVALVFMIIMAAFYGSGPALPANLWRDRGWFFNGFAASGLAACVSYALVYPVKYLSPLWLWPGALWQTAIIAVGGICSWAFFQWKNTR